MKGTQPPTTAHNRCTQRGAYLVEFALTYAVFMFVLLGCVEVARVMYTWSALNHVTQRGARVAAVCPVNDSKIAQIAVFGTQDSDGGSTDSSLIPGVTASNISVSYQDEAGNSSTDYAAIRFVTVSVNAYTHQMLIPNLLADFVSPALTAPAFSTTLPVESLGYNPDTETRVCFA